MKRLLLGIGSGLALATAAAPASAQVQIRLAEPGRANYSELHEGLREGTPAADSVLAILRSRNTHWLWGRVTAVINGDGPWNDALLALTRLALLRDRQVADSALRIRRFFQRAGPYPFPKNPGVTSQDLEPSIQAILLERRRAVRGDAAVLTDILGRIRKRDYDHGDAWVLGRLGAGARDSIVARFLTADSVEFRVRYLTLLSYFTDPALIPLLSRVYVWPDSFRIPLRYAVRASDGLLWIGTRASLVALLDARERARGRRIYADTSLARGGYSFLDNDSAAVVARTGKWLTEWLETLPPR